MTRKKALRAELIARRDALTPAERRRYAEALSGALVALPQYASARSVLATMSIGSELDTRAFLDRAKSEGKAIVLPRIAGQAGKLELHAVDDLDRDLVPGVWNIPEPDPARGREMALAEVDFAWIPALAADRAGHRLGYGAGYFDKLLSGRGSRPYCVVALPEPFVRDDIPHEPHDVPVDLVLTTK
jgi:5-formyltetrahydrofolate cyclo-ligase